MKKVINTQGHPITPHGGSVIPAYGQGKVDETHPANQALIEDGALRVLEPEKKPARSANSDDKEKSE